MITFLAIVFTLALLVVVLGSFGWIMRAMWFSLEKKSSQHFLALHARRAGLWLAYPLAISAMVTADLGGWTILAATLPALAMSWFIVGKAGRQFVWESLEKDYTKFINTKRYYAFGKSFTSSTPVTEITRVVQVGRAKYYDQNDNLLLVHTDAWDLKDGKEKIC